MILQNIRADIRLVYEHLKCGLMREVRGKGVYIRRDTNYNYKSEHFEFMLCEKIMERGSALGEDMLTLVAEIQNTVFILYPESILSSKTQLQELLMSGSSSSSTTTSSSRTPAPWQQWWHQFLIWSRASCLKIR